MVNFTNILYTHLRQYSFTERRSNLKCKYKKSFAQNFSYKKDARKMLVKLTQGGFMSTHQLFFFYSALMNRNSLDSTHPLNTFDTPTTTSTTSITTTTSTTSTITWLKHRKNDTTLLTLFSYICFYRYQKSKQLIK